MVGGGIRDRSVPFQCLRVLLFVSKTNGRKGERWKKESMPLAVWLCIMSRVSD